MKRPALDDHHRRSGARFVEHQQWEVPAGFGSTESEAETVRKHAGICDVSWLAKIDVKGKYSREDLALEDGAVFWALGSAKSRYVWLAITGYVFYGYWNPRFCLLMAFSTLVSYSAG